jgi:ribA/ribD-fused uncharacterized protein
MTSTLKIKKQGITKLSVDCIVNAANSQLQHGGGVCGAIFAEAGAKELEAACNKYGSCPTGEAVLTPAFKLKARYIAHAVGPVWHGGDQNEAQLLYRCYHNAMKIAFDEGCRTIAFPLISSGIYGYPVEEAWEIAINAILECPCKMDVTIAVIDDAALALGNRILAKATQASSVSKNTFVFFWHEYAENGHFSQWYPASFRVEGITYLHNEQYMMAKKALLFKDTRTYNKIMAEADPAVCKALGKSAANFDQQLWDSCKDEIIYNANYAKFSQNPALKAALLATGDAIIAEASPGDKIWGIGMKATDPNSKDPSKWPGQNLLGKALMRVRSELRDSSK